MPGEEAGKGNTALPAKYLRAASVSLSILLGAWRRGGKNTSPGMTLHSSDGEGPTATQSMPPMSCLETGGTVVPRIDDRLALVENQLRDQLTCRRGHRQPMARHARGEDQAGDLLHPLNDRRIIGRDIDYAAPLIDWLHIRLGKRRTELLQRVSCIHIFRI